MTADSQLTIATGASVINRGGTVHLFGDTIELQDHSLVDVSSESGGGEAWIGGSPLGQSPHVPHAKVTSMAATAAIRADGGQFGNGGNIVVWADERAIVLGSGNISARGGTVSGNGGHIETSARGQVITDAAPNASATNGTAGEWLLDPFNITVTSSGTSSLTNNALSASALGTTITAATIKAALEAGNNVTLRTTNIAGAENGDIIIDQAISVDLSNRTVTLNLIAVGGVRINQAISATNGRLLIQIDAQQDVVVNASVTTNGGSFSSQGRAFTNTASIDTGVGGLTVDHVDDISINGSLDAGPIDLSSSAGDIVSNAAGAMDSHGFNAHFQSNRITLGAAVNSTGGTSSTIVTFDARTTGTSIGLGDGAAGTLALTTATLNRVQSNFGQIVVGSSNQTGRVEIGSNASPLTIANTGLRVTMSSNVNSILDLNNNLTLSQSGKVLQFLGTGSRLNVSKDLTVATTSGAITIAGNATLAGGATLTVTSNTAANNGANITISGSFSGDNTANTIEGLVVSGGTGNVTLGANASSTIGTIGVPFNDVSISSAQNVTLNSSIVAQSLVVAATNQVTLPTTLHLRGVDATTNRSLDITARNIDVPNTGQLTFTSTAGGIAFHGVGGGSLDFFNGNLDLANASVGSGILIDGAFTEVTARGNLSTRGGEINIQPLLKLFATAAIISTNNNGQLGGADLVLGTGIAAGNANQTLNLRLGTGGDLLGSSANIGTAANTPSFKSVVVESAKDASINQLKATDNIQIVVSRWTSNGELSSSIGPISIRATSTAAGDSIVLNDVEAGSGALTLQSGAGINLVGGADSINATAAWPT